MSTMLANVPSSSSIKLLSVLRQHPIFRDLAPEALNQLCRYAKHTVLKRDATIFAKDDPGNSFYAVISGTVKISISSPDGRNTILNLIGPGELFGEMTVLDGEPRSADATANTNCEIFAIDRRDFLPFLLSQPTLGMKIIVLLCRQVRWTTDRAEQLIRRDLPGRLASTLLDLTENPGSTPKAAPLRLCNRKPITSSKAGGLVGNRQRRF
jgi:CRP-like cAMP-binding protein